MSDRLPRRIVESLPALPTQRPEASERLPAVIAAMDDLKAMRTFVASELKPEHDFGVIPGTSKKPTLLLPGAQKIAMFYNTAPDYEVERVELGNGHLECLVKTKLIQRSSGIVAASGLGSCSSFEKKYRYRSGERKCPHCGESAIIKGKKEYGGGWLCFKNKGGCGVKFRDNDPAIAGQEVGQVENPDIHDVRNTVLKIACKRSLVSACMSLGCMSELFTQDIEDIYDITQYAVAEEAQPPKPQNNSGHKTGQYASPEQIEAFRRATIDFCAARNAEWADIMSDERGELREGVKDLLHPSQMTSHLLKWALRTERLAPVGMTYDPDSGKPTERVSVEQAKGYMGIVYAREPEAVAEEAMAYFDQERDAAIDDWRKKHGSEDVYSTEGGMEN